MTALTDDEREFIEAGLAKLTPIDAAHALGIGRIIDGLAGRIDDLERVRDSPETADFIRGIQIEVAHQRERWKATDPVKTAADWFWLVGYLAGKALHSAMHGDSKKALHHTVTAAAALANWHSAMNSDSVSGA